MPYRLELYLVVFSCQKAQTLQQKVPIYFEAISQGLVSLNQLIFQLETLFEREKSWVISEACLFALLLLECSKRGYINLFVDV